MFEQMKSNYISVVNCGGAGGIVSKELSVRLCSEFSLDRGVYPP